MRPTKRRWNKTGSRLPPDEFILRSEDLFQAATNSTVSEDSILCFDYKFGIAPQQFNSDSFNSRGSINQAEKRVKEYEDNKIKESSKEDEEIDRYESWKSSISLEDFDRTKLLFK